MSTAIFTEVEGHILMGLVDGDHGPHDIHASEALVECGDAEWGRTIGGGTGLYITDAGKERLASWLDPETYADFVEAGKLEAGMR